MMHIFLFPTISPAVDFFEDMSPFAASNLDIPLAAQTEEAENGSELHFCTTSCSVLLAFFFCLLPSLWLLQVALIMSCPWLIVMSSLTRSPLLSAGSADTWVCLKMGHSIPQGMEFQ
jgi:hypothetical protein